MIFIFKPYRINFINKKEIENYCKKNKDENHQNIFNYFRDKEIKNQKNLNFKSQNESFKKIISYLIIRKGEKKKIFSWIVLLWYCGLENNNKP